MYLEVSDNAKFVNLGVNINDEICYFRVNFISNSTKWGFRLVDPDGNNYERFNTLGDEIDFEFIFEDKMYELIIIAPHDGMYEIILLDRNN